MSKRKAADAFGLTGQPWFSRIVPSRTLADLLGKRWMESAVPLSLALLIVVGIVAFVPVGMQDFGSIADQVASLGLVAIGLTIVMIAGGIDLSVGSILGVSALASLTLDRAFNVPLPLALLLSVLVGVVLGAVNGALIAGLNTRPFITTLITLIVFRGVATWIQTEYALQLAVPRENIVWDFLGMGSILGISASWWIFIVVLVAAHLVVTRSRWGWHATSVGSDRRSARRNGIKINLVVFSTYVLSGGLAGLAGILATAQLGRADGSVGDGAELVVLTAVVLGGVSLTGGRGSVVRATVGMFIVASLQQASIVLHLKSGYFSTILSVVLVVFAVLDLKWGKYRQRISDKLFLNPANVALGPLIDVTQAGSVWTVNRRLTDAPPIGIGQIEGAEDCAIDAEGRLYCGDRRGWIWRFPAEETSNGAVFARTGGAPLGHAWDVDGSLIVAVGGIGVMRVRPDGSTEVVANRVPRRLLSLRDDSALRFADDLDVAPDGSIYVSDFSTRTNLTEYMNEFVESRPNGRVVRIDPDGTTEVVVKNYLFPNGICTTHDGQSILIASTGLFRVDRLWISGPKQGQLEPVMQNLPGYPDNINRSSDGNYWMAFLAMRTPVSDLLMKYPGVRRRMTKELPSDDWVVPQLNVSCVVKFTDRGEILKVLWDGSLENYPMVTSINEHDGRLYLCGIHNNRIGRLDLDPEDIGAIDPGAIPGGASRFRAGVEMRA
jgi:ribose transport system permease protein